MTTNLIPNPVIAKCAKILQDSYSGTQLDNIFLAADVPGNPPSGYNNKLGICTHWLKQCNTDPGRAFSILGKILEDLMDDDSDLSVWVGRRSDIKGILGAHGLQYSKGGVINRVDIPVVVLSLEEKIRAHDWQSVRDEMRRANANIDSDPPAALTAASAILEALFKIYIETKGLEVPHKQTINRLWKAVQDDLGLDPAKFESDQDIKSILGGLAGIVGGIGALRTHAGSAHGRGTKPYKIEGRHARLTVGSAQVLANFVMETWDTRTSSGK